MDWYFMAGMAGGITAGVVSNPVDLVFSRMQVDEMYPEGYRRNYKSFLDGMMRACDEGVLLRGAVANGLRIGMICSSMTGVYDWCKENSYFFLGPSWINRLWATAAATIVGVTASLPFDAVRVRMHTMRPLPDDFPTRRPGTVSRRYCFTSRAASTPATPAAPSMQAHRRTELGFSQFAFSLSSFWTTTTQGATSRSSGSPRASTSSPESTTTCTSPSPTASTNL